MSTIWYAVGKIGELLLRKWIESREKKVEKLHAKKNKIEQKITSLTSYINRKK